MKQFIDKLIERLEELQKLNYEAYETAQWNNDKIMYINASNAYANAITEVNQLAEEYLPETNVGNNLQTIDASELFGNSEQVNDSWIACSERLPESGTSVIVSYKDRFLTQADGTCEGWYDATNMIWHLTDYEYSDNVEVIAWRERLAPYQPKGE